MEDTKKIMTETPQAIDLEKQNSIENNDDDIVEEKKKKGWLNTAIDIILVIAIIFAVAATYVSFVTTSGNGVPSIFGIQFLAVQTDSMYPTLKPDDLIVNTKLNSPSDLRPNDIITYWTIIDGNRVLNTHRILNVYDAGGHLKFETKGDGKELSDPLVVHEKDVVGIFRFRIPGLGKVFNYLQTSTGFLLVVVIPVFLFFLYHLVQFFRLLFEYQNVKNRIKYEQERGRTEDLIIAAQATEMARQEAERRRLDEERAKLEEELREKLRAELIASMAAEKAAEAATVDSSETPHDSTEDVSGVTLETAEESTSETET